MRKHGPDLLKDVPAIQRCRQCRGKGFTKGVFFELDCAGCDGTGWVALDGQPVGDAVKLIRALGRRLDKVEQQAVDRAKASTWDAQDNNRRGAGGSHWTGD
ncbi:hypothetical protein [Pseudomonas citronellolis]|uniref:hypothetical protein n=1 Tax=Pseudomonas citronellolis TaxID=53408 RepID=UPI0023E44723|nr:hypothetical protein [Pseudomonas citronellolis]MDF3932136.1 hypothetical protein [Pseudomonas citronellolis]